MQAIIREADCIGCTKCIKACPFDAIIGAPKLMHTVLKTECTGCGLCIPPCPINCIEWAEIEHHNRDSEHAQKRYHARTLRLAKQATQRTKHLTNLTVQATQTLDLNASAQKKLLIQAAIARARAKKLNL